MHKICRDLEVSIVTIETRVRTDQTVKKRLVEYQLECNMDMTKWNRSPNSVGEAFLCFIGYYVFMQSFLLLFTTGKLTRIETIRHIISCA